jgi:hypothetical protein
LRGDGQPTTSVDPPTTRPEDKGPTTRLDESDPIAYRVAVLADTGVLADRIELVEPAAIKDLPMSSATKANKQAEQDITLDIYAATLDGVVRRVRQIDGYQDSPVFNPVSKRIFFLQARSPKQKDDGIRRMTLTGGSPTTILKVWPCANLHVAANGKFLIYWESRGLYRATTGGKTPKLLTASGFESDVNSTCDLIVFSNVFYENDQFHTVFGTILPDGQGERTIFRTQGWCGSPRFIDNGSRIAFSVLDVGEPELDPGIHSIGLDGNDASVILAREGVSEIACRPDGALVFAARADSSHHQLFWLESRGRDVKQITYINGSAREPAFAGDEILFFALPPGMESLVKTMHPLASTFRLAAMTPWHHSIPHRSSTDPAPAFASDCPAVYVKKSSLKQRDGKIYGYFECNFNQACLSSEEKYWEADALERPTRVGKCSITKEAILKFRKK